MSEAVRGSGPPEEAGSPAPDRHGFAVTLALLALGGLALLVAHSRTWSTTTVGGSGQPVLTVALTGSDIDPGGAAVAVLAFAAIAGLLATRRTGRVIIGVLLVLSGAAVALSAIDFGMTWQSALGAGDTILGLATDRLGVDAEGATTSVTSWWLLAAVGGALVMVAGFLAVLRGGRWPQLGRRFERGAVPVGAASGAAVDAGSPARQESAWDQLDRGVDPTRDDSDPRGWDGGPAADTMTPTPAEEDPR